jgi:hypothetical protein
MGDYTRTWNIQMHLSDMPHTNHHSRTHADRNVVAELKSGQFPHGNKLKSDDNRREIGRDPQYR